MSKKHLSKREKGLNSQSNFQLNYFNSPESAETKGILKIIII